MRLFQRSSGVSVPLIKETLSLELAYLGKPVRQFRNFACCTYDGIIITCLYTLAAQIAVEVVDHVDELGFALYAVMRTYIGAFFAALAQLRIDVYDLLAEAYRAVLFDVCLIY